MQVPRLFMLILGLLLASFTEPALAGGLYLNEFATPSMGVASAGAEAVAMDASTALHNPAGMTRLKGKELMLGGGLGFAKVEFDPAPNTPVPGNDGGDAGGPVPLISGSYVHPLSEDWRLGLAGAALEYDDNWTGRFLVQNVSLLSVIISPTIAYRVNDWLSVGGGVNLWYAALDMEVAAPPPAGTGKVEIDGDDVEANFSLSALFEVSERTRLGVIYFSETEFNFSGDATIQPPGISAGIDTRVPLAQFIRGGIYHEINDTWALLGTIAWEDWSTFDNQNIFPSHRDKNINNCPY